MAGDWLYFMTNRRDGILYAGVTSNLPRRTYEHREGLVEGFTKRLIHATNPDWDDLYDTRI